MEPIYYRSPKRKRGATDTVDYTPNNAASLPRISTNVQSHSIVGSNTANHDDGEGNDSPRSYVATKFDGLALREGKLLGIGHVKKRIAHGRDHETTGQRRPELQDDHRDIEQSANSASAPEPSQLTQQESAGHLGPAFPTKTTFSFDANSDTRAIPDLPQRRSNSPSLQGDPEDNPMTWHESEITGHDPVDPDDDGEGINGIGFKPTAQEAWARSAKRKQQLAEYKSRETREARQRRSERRKFESSDPTSEEGEGSAKRKAVRVHFEDG